MATIVKLDPDERAGNLGKSIGQGLGDYFSRKEKEERAKEFQKAVVIISDPKKSPSERASAIAGIPSSVWEDPKSAAALLGVLGTQQEAAKQETEAELGGRHATVEERGATTGEKTQEETGRHNTAAELLQGIQTSQDWDKFIEEAKIQREKMRSEEGIAAGHDITALNVAGIRAGAKDDKGTLAREKFTSHELELAAKGIDDIFNTYKAAGMVQVIESPVFRTAVSDAKVTSSSLVQKGIIHTDAAAMGIPRTINDTLNGIQILTETEPDRMAPNLGEDAAKLRSEFQNQIGVAAKDWNEEYLPRLATKPLEEFNPADTDTVYQYAPQRKDGSSRPPAYFVVVDGDVIPISPNLAKKYGNF